MTRTDIPAWWDISDWEYVDADEIDDLITRAQTYLVEVSSVTHCPGHPLLPVDAIDIEKRALRAFQKQKERRDNDPDGWSYRSRLRQYEQHYKVQERISPYFSEIFPPKPRKKVPKRPRKKVPKRA